MGTPISHSSLESQSSYSRGVECRDVSEELSIVTSRALLDVLEVVVTFAALVLRDSRVVSIPTILIKPFP